MHGGGRGDYNLQVALQLDHKHHFMGAHFNTTFTLIYIHKDLPLIKCTDKHPSQTPSSYFYAARNILETVLKSFEKNQGSNSNQGTRKRHLPQ